LSLFNELKRRNVIRVGVAYLAGSWLLIEIAETIFPLFGFDDTPARIMVIVLAIGFPLFLLFSWVFEFTPEGLKKEKDIDRAASVTHKTGKQLDRIIIILLALALGYFGFDKFVLSPERQAAELATATETAHQEGRTEALVESYGDNSIAVLPFVNMSSDPENEFFSDGIAEEILNVLASISDLKVAARTSAFSYKGTKTNISRIAEELGVTHILEGSVRKSSNQVRVTAQLIKADDGFNVWSQTYDRELINIFAIQDEIAESIAAALKVSLRLESRPAGNLTGTNSIEAYEHYLKGISFWHERTLISLESASKEFEAAATLDPQFAKAWAGQALFWIVLNQYTNKTVADTVDRARTAARRALSLDPESVESMAVLGLIAKNPSVAFEYFDRAIELNPSYANTYHWYSVRLAYLGDPEASLAMTRKAWTLDPRAPNNSYVLAVGLSGLGYNREAEQITQELLRYAPEHLFGLREMLVLKILSGECASARQYGDKLAELLNKKINSTQVYMDLCQQDNPAVRAAAVKTVSTWPLSAFYNPAEPNLSSGESTITLLTELGELDAAWQLLEKYNSLARIRTRLTENGISLQCDPRVQKLAERLGKSDAIKPVSCD
jgi:TolB-like protein/Tfp pilus assembly protein PilF